MEDFSLSIEGEGKKLVIKIKETAWIENEKGERVEFSDAKEMNKELYLAVENLFNSRRG